YVNLGLAAATERGLIVPNIKNAHELNQRQMAEAIQELTQRARDGKTQPTELADGTITITNIGVLGLDAGTPILNPGESGIIASGAIKQQPWGVDGQLEPGWSTTLAASSDHRSAGGAVARAPVAGV